MGYCLQPQRTIFLIIIVVIAVFIHEVYCSQPIGGTCSSYGDCNAGLRCDSCPASGSTQSRCIRTRPINAKSKVDTLPFNRYTWLTTHNSYALLGAPPLVGQILVGPRNQEDNVTSQLKNGVRGLMLDVYDFAGDVWLCHSFEGKCYPYTAFKKAIDVLLEVAYFLEHNPTEIITIFFEDYVESRARLSGVLNRAGLDKYMFPLSRMPRDGGDWPPVDDMLRNNQRLVVFTSKRTQEGIAYEWDHVVENQYGNGGMVDGSCPPRAESLPMNSTRRSLVLQNYFPDAPNITMSCVDNSEALMNMLTTCRGASLNRWPNFIAVDFYMRSDGGGAQAAVDAVNGRVTCGCDTIGYCKANEAFGTCDVPRGPSPSIPEQRGTQQISFATSEYEVFQWHCVLPLLFMVAFLSHIDH